MGRESAGLVLPCSNPALVLTALGPLARAQPVVRINGRFTVYPGIPTLFTSLLLATTPYLPLPPDSAKPFRRLIATEQPESSIAPFLTALQAEVRKEGIRVGSCTSILISLPTACRGSDGISSHAPDPSWKVGVTVSLIGKDLARLEELEQRVCFSSFLSSLATAPLPLSLTLLALVRSQVVKELQGTVVRADKLGDAA